MIVGFEGKFMAEIEGNTGINQALPTSEPSKVGTETVVTPPTEPGWKSLVKKIKKAFTPKGQEEAKERDERDERAILRARKHLNILDKQSEMIVAKAVRDSDEEGDFRAFLIVVGTELLRQDAEAAKANEALNMMKHANGELDRES